MSLVVEDDVFGPKAVFAFYCFGCGVLFFKDICFDEVIVFQFAAFDIGLPRGGF